MKLPFGGTYKLEFWNTGPADVKRKRFSKIIEIETGETLQQVDLMLEQ